MTPDMPVGSPAEPAGFWHSRPLNRILLVVVSIFITFSLVSDVVTAMGGEVRLSPATSLVNILTSLSFYVLWMRTTYAFVGLIPALLASHMVGESGSVAFLMLVLPLMLAVVAATATKVFSYMALTVAIVWAAFIPVTSPDDGDVVWITLPLILAAWGIGFFIGWSLDRRAQDRRRLAEATRRAAIAAQEERRSLARDLHDIVAHNLTIISMQARAATYAGTDEAAKTAVDVIGSSAGEALVDLRRMLSLLQAEGLVAGDRESAQRDLGEGASALDLEYGAVKFGRMLESLGIYTTVDTDTLEQDIPQSVETALYRVLQEAVTNVAKHSGEGGECRIAVHVRDGQLELAVDNTLPESGSATRAGWNSSGSGLIGMRDRVDAFGGTMSSARDGHWWRVRAEVPLHGANA
ncbi:histidine kinase [Citricoccus sp.]|uniref:histidine kinase n=1 Tax=Citricoccus sp. TaxID=1978372 RepID=UPI0028BD5B8C|nr:histidine kinase [Citricoccus sp.]